MAEYSEVKAGLDRISDVISNSRNRYEKSKEAMVNARSALVSLTSEYSDVVATINGYDPLDLNPAEANAKAELDKLVAEFIALRNAIQADLNAMGVPF